MFNIAIFRKAADSSRRGGLRGPAGRRRRVPAGGRLRHRRGREGLEILHARKQLRPLLLHPGSAAGEVGILRIGLGLGTVWLNYVKDIWLSSEPDSAVIGMKGSPLDDVDNGYISENDSETKRSGRCQQQ